MPVGNHKRLTHIVLPGYSEIPPSFVTELSCLRHFLVMQVWFAAQAGWQNFIRF